MLRSSCTEDEVWGLEFRVWGLGFGVWGVGFYHTLYGMEWSSTVAL